MAACVAWGERGVIRRGGCLWILSVMKVLESFVRGNHIADLHLKSLTLARGDGDLD